MTAGGVREMVGQGLGDGREVAGRRQDRGVVGVVRGTEEHRRRGGIDPRQLQRVAVAHRRVGQRVGGLHLVAVHQRDDRPGFVAVRPVRADEQRFLVGVVPEGVPPGSLEGPA